MKIIIPDYSTSKIIKPTEKDYRALGIQSPEDKTIFSPTLDEIRNIAGINLTYEIQIVKKGFFCNKPSSIYAPSDEDCQRLGIRNDFTVSESGEVSRKSYSIDDNIAYVEDNFGSLVESIARSSAVVTDVLKKGAVNMKFLIPGLPITGLGLRNPEVKEIITKGGTRLRDALFPNYEAINKSIPTSESTGITSNGLEYVLY